uniref:LicD/FKTN/FKRP nucleotidyltransferase domain-containing protein n=1 Tax=Haptolina brevifila TaxID=156173 RepID=A0A7S2JDE6_9EUKA|mmetsp:Transcript_80685/g.160292  ORF Transcript_80685/g.160292 Transcript_80685/m.160292 type:complete len:214 (+) Transcript_80685:748-1389(+)
MYNQLEAAVAIFDAAGIRYHLVAGSALGLARHGGIIPWDDDVDIAVHADDADKVWALRDQFAAHSFPLVRADIGFKFGSGGIDDSCVRLENGDPTYFNPYLAKGLPFQPGHPFKKVTSDIFTMKELGEVDGVPVLRYCSEFCQKVWPMEVIPKSGWYSNATASFGGIQVRALPAPQLDWYLSHSFGPTWATHDGKGQLLKEFDCLRRTAKVVI